jgi:hypothetical protein
MLLRYPVSGTRIRIDSVFPAETAVASIRIPPGRFVVFAKFEITGRNAIVPRPGDPSHTDIIYPLTAVKLGGSYMGVFDDSALGHYRMPAIVLTTIEASTDLDLSLTAQLFDARILSTDGFAEIVPDTMYALEVGSISNVFPS